MPNLVEIMLVVQGMKSLIVVKKNSFVIISPLKKGPTLHLNKLISSSPKDDRNKVWYGLPFSDDLKGSMYIESIVNHPYKR